VKKCTCDKARKTHRAARLAYEDAAMASNEAWYQRKPEDYRKVSRACRAAGSAYEHAIWAYDTARAACLVHAPSEIQLTVN